MIKHRNQAVTIQAFRLVHIVERPTDSEYYAPVVDIREACGRVLSVPLTALTDDSVRREITERIHELGGACWLSCREDMGLCGNAVAV